MKALKATGWALAVIVLLVVGTAIYLSWKFDSVWAREELARVVYAQKQRHLRIDALRLSLFPRPALVADGVSLSERQADRPFAKLERLYIRVQLLPLMSRRIVADRLEAKGLDMALVRHRDGKLNIEDLLARDDRSPAAFDFGLDGLEIVEGQVSFTDEATARRWAFGDVALTTGPLGPVAGGALTLSARWGAEATQALKATATYRIDVSNRRFGFADLEASIVNGGGDATALVGRLKTASLNAGEVEIEGLRIEARKGVGQGVPLFFVEAPRLAVGGGRISGAPVSARFELSSDGTRLNGRLATTEIAGDAHALHVDKVEAHWTLRQEDGTVVGQLAGPLQLRLDEHRVALPRFAGEMSVNHPALLQALRVPVAGHLAGNWAESHLQSQLSAELDETRLDAQWRLTPAKAEATVVVDRLDLDRYLRPDRPAPKEPAPAKPSEDRPAFGNLNLDARASVGLLQFQGAKFKDVRLALRLVDGRLQEEAPEPDPKAVASSASKTSSSGEKRAVR